MIENVKIKLVDLPCSIRGFTKLHADGTCTVVLNSRLSREQNEKTFQHELNHIRNDDLYRDVDIQQLEYDAHAL